MWKNCLLSRSARAITAHASGHIQLTASSRVMTGILQFAFSLTGKPERELALRSHKSINLSFAAG
jgi:hypothetical protein